MTCKLYRHFAENGDLLYVGISLDVFARTRNHASSSPWFNEIKTISIEFYESKKAALVAEEQAIKKELPKHNKEHRIARQPKTIELEIIKIIPFDKWCVSDKRKYKKLTSDQIDEIKLNELYAERISYRYKVNANTIMFIRGQEREDELAMARYIKKKECYERYRFLRKLETDKNAQQYQYSTGDAK